MAPSDSPALPPESEPLMASEFDLIARYFAPATPVRADVAAGIGDDAALLLPPAGCEVVSACTALHEGVDFPFGTPPGALGRRAVEDGLRTLAAHASPGTAPRPAWALLGLTLPAPDDDWVREFAAGLAAVCGEAGIQLVGGDTTRGPRTIVCVLHALARISPQLSAADADLLAVPRRTPSSHFDAGTATSSAARTRSFGPWALSQRHLHALATKAGETSGPGPQSG